MIFVRLFDEPLAQASYVIGCTASGTAIVVDPNRCIERYLEVAAAHGLRIAAVTETHIHADFVSGSRDLARRTDAALYLSAAGPPEWQYAYRSEPNVKLLRHGSTIHVGNVELTAVHTPGHTPEHMSFVVSDTAVAHEPMGVLTGDFVFVGDVGRPDLLETVVKVEGAGAAGARQLFTSLAWFKSLPDHLQVWPGHGAGSACGKGLSAVPQSTVGYERRFNWGLGITDEAEFVRRVLEGQPEAPAYFSTMKRLNREGPPERSPLFPERVPSQRLAGLLETGTVVVDTRPAPDFAAGHIPGTLSIPFDKSFPTWAGSLLSFDRDLYLLGGYAAGHPALREVVAGLSMIGLDRIRGYFEADVFDDWVGQGHALETVAQIAVAQLASARERFAVLDVRGRSEWQRGHVPGAILIPLGELPNRLAELPVDRPITVHCQGGGRSAIAAGVLQAQGFKQASNLTGGFGAWALAGLPVEQDQA